MRPLFIVNPAAGHGRALDRWRAVFAAAASRLPSAEVRLTRFKGHGAALAREGLEQGFAEVVAVGGDGTLAEVVHGYLTTPEEVRGGACLGTWPAGSGCDAARHLGLAADGPADVLVELLARPEVRRLDAGRVEYTEDGGTLSRASYHFFNVAAAGLAGDVALELERSGKRWGGTMSYLLSSVRGLLFSRAEPLLLTVDGVPEPPARYHLVALANASAFGGGMRLAPGADLQDGLFDLVTVADMPRARLLSAFTRVYRGSHGDVPGVRLRRVRRVEARSSHGTPVRLNVDGEAMGVLPAVFEALPSAVPFLCPRKG